MNESAEFAAAARQQGKHYEALARLFDANARDGNDPDVLYHIGVLLADIGCMEASLYFLQSAEAKRPGWIAPIMDSGAVHAAMGSWRKAVECCDAALALDATDPTPLLHSANLLSRMGEHSDAKARYEEALNIDPMNLSVWSDFFLSMNYTDVKSDEKARHIRRFNDIFSSVFPERKMDRKPREGIRIGYVSSDLRNHAMSYFLKGIFPHHDRSRFSIFFYHCSPVSDDITREIGRFGKMVDCSSMSDEKLHETILSHDIDILVDLNGHTTGNRLKVFMMRSAPVQMSWLGFAGTSACPNMDYKLIEEGTATKADRTLYTERILTAKGIISYDPPSYNIQPKELPMKTNGYTTYACFNNPRKLNGQTLDAWKEILRRNEASRLVVLTTGGKDKDDELLERLGQKESGRVSFMQEMGTEDFISSMSMADVSLDPFPHGGGTTAAHALWMGVPTITLKGETELQMSSLLMETNGLGWFVSSSVEEYIEKAASISEDLLDRKRRPFEDTGHKAARSLEEVYASLVS